MAGQWQGGQWQPGENVQPGVQPHVQFPPFTGSPGQQYPPPPQSPYPPQYGPPPSYGPPSPQPPRRSRKGLAFLGCGGFAALFILIAALVSHPSSSSSPSALPTLPTVAVSQAAAPASTAARAAAKTVATFSGSGTQSTAPFTVSANWAVAYSFDCSGFGYKGNFIIMEDGSFSGAMDVNVLDMKKSGTSYAYGDAGTHYLKVTTECAWTVKVVDEG